MSRPEVPPPFAWRDTPYGLVLECGPLAAIARHCFTTRGIPFGSEPHRMSIAELVGATRTVTRTQVHGRDVFAIRRGLPIAADPPSGDALVSDHPDVAIAVRAADCVPLLLADSRTGAVAAVHAGWRGTAAGIASAAVQALTDEFGSRPADLVAAIGPSIGPCCYDVGSELVDAFAAAGHPRHLIDRWFALKDRGSGFSDWKGSSLVLDVAGANRDQLVLAGVPEDRIHLSGLCTAMHLEWLTSYRAEKESAGRLAAVIRAR